MSGAFSTAFADAFDIEVSATEPPVEIPPPISAIGDIEDRRLEIIERVAKAVHSDTDDEWIATAVDAAIVFTISQTGRDDLGLPGDALTVSGVVLFAERIYLDTPNGAQVAVADPTFEPIYQPENLWKHVRHYFKRLTVSWGVG